MKFTPMVIPEVILVEPVIYGDRRGFFLETWQQRKFAGNGIDVQFVQDNHSRSAQGILRGLHYQIQNAQGKLVRVIHGEIYDVVVDLRRSSPTFGKWLGVNLSEENKAMLWIPPGFAHGFYVLSPQVDCLYKCTDYYAPEFERTIRWDDPELAIAWPLLDGREPLLAAKDANGASFRAAEYFP